MTLNSSMAMEIIPIFFMYATLLLIPGQSMAVVFCKTQEFGWTGGWLTAIGSVGAHLFHLIVALAYLQLLDREETVIIKFIEIAGCLSLTYLGVKLIKKSWLKNQVTTNCLNQRKQLRRLPPLKRLGFISKGWLGCILSGKSAAFFASFGEVILSLKLPLVGQVLVVICIAVIGISFWAGFVWLLRNNWFQKLYDHFSHLINRGMGLVLCAYACTIALH